MPLFVSIVLDGVGIGEQPDAAAYGDEGSHTLAHVCETSHPNLPNLARLGLGNICPLGGIAPQPALACYGRMQEVSAGKDSTTGHWELAGLRLERPFPTYPNGFPPDVLDRFLALTGFDGVLGNKPASGTDIIAELGEEHQRSGRPIVYTSADSVFQVAAHTDTIPLEEQYRICRIARQEVCVGEHSVGRVIARPFHGRPGAYERISAARKDLALKPPPGTIQVALQKAGVRTVSVGKISDLFDHVGFDEAYKTKSNAEGIEQTITQMRANQASTAFIWVNLVDFDQEYGHRNDPNGFAYALEEFDRELPRILDALPAGGRLLITADHGNDPITPSTDHSREYVPVLLYGGAEDVDLGIRPSFNDHAATVANYFKIPFVTAGTSFLK